jgi:chemotaxis signal transduction protein
MDDPALVGDTAAATPDAPGHAATDAATTTRVDDALASIDPDLLAELMNDPALAGDVPAIAVPPPRPARETPAPVVERAPSPTPAPAVPDLSAFLPPAGASIAPVARVAVAAADAMRTRTATGGNRWLRVCVGVDSYAFELLRVQEVVRVAPVVAMRGAGHAVLGVMNLRGRIVPVFDLGLWLDVGAVRVEERSRIVVIERDDELIGVLVTAVEDVVSLSREHVEPPLAGADPGPTLGVARVAAAPTVLLDADALFD